MSTSMPRPPALTKRDSSSSPVALPPALSSTTPNLPTLPLFSPLRSLTSASWKRAVSVNPSSTMSPSKLPPASTFSFSPTSRTPSMPARTSSSSASSPTSSSTPSSSFSSLELSLFHRSLSPADAAYLRELTSYSFSRLEREPGLLRQQASDVHASIESLAVSHYRTFVETAEAVHGAHQAVVDMEAQLGMVEEALPRFAARCEEFMGKAAGIRKAQRLNRLMMDHHSNLLDLLEIPQLMDTCVRSSLFEEALDLYAYAASLAKRHPTVPVIQDVLHDMRGIKRSIHSALLALLSSHIQLAQCLKVTSYLRRLEGYDEATLRQQFLSSRDEYVAGLLRAVQGSGYEFAAKYLDIVRVQLFDIVTQYRAIFVDDTSTTAEEERNDDGGLLYRWIHHRVALLIAMLAQQLPAISEGSYIYNLLEQCVYCGTSLARVGVDFRPLLPPLFEECVLSMYTRSLEGAVDALRSGMAQYAWYMAQKELTRMGLPLEKNAALLSFPPLVLVANVFIHALNRLRHCALLSLAPAILAATQQTLLALAQQLRAHAGQYERRPLSSPEWEGERDALAVLAKGMADEMVGYVDGLVGAVYGEGGGLDVGKVRAVLQPLYEEEERERAKRAEERRRREEERRKEEERRQRVQEKQEREREERRLAEEERKRQEEVNAAARAASAQLERDEDNGDSAETKAFE